MSLREHALLSASAAKRWLSCPPSAKIAYEMPDTKTVYAAEGDLAHEFAELFVRKAWAEKAMPPKVYQQKLDELRTKPLYSPSMEEHAKGYADYITGVLMRRPETPFVSVETRVDYSEYAPGGFGTSDFFSVQGEDMHIIDFKYGQGVPVYADDNPQMKLYALGALKYVLAVYDIKRIHLHIYQPRINNESEWELSFDDLIAWGESIKPIAQTAFNGEGEFCAGEHCQFCPIKATCRTRATAYLDLEPWVEKEPAELSREEIGDLLTRAQGLKKWAADLEEYALAQCLSGADIKGWKSVEGRSNRAFSDIDRAYKILAANGVSEADLYERKPITLTTAEKLVGKATLAALVGELIIKPPGKPALAPESDKRPKLLAGSTAAEDFAEGVEE